MIHMIRFTLRFIRIINKKAKITKHKNLTATKYNVTIMNLIIKALIWNRIKGCIAKKKKKEKETHTNLRIILFWWWHDSVTVGSRVSFIHYDTIFLHRIYTQNGSVLIYSIHTCPYQIVMFPFNVILCPYCLCAHPLIRVHYSINEKPVYHPQLYDKKDVKSCIVKI